MNSKTIITIFYLTVAQGPRGADAAELRLTSDAAVAKALASNKHLQAAQLELRRARMQLFWEGRLDNPELELAAASDGLGRGEGEATFEVAFSQRFPLTSKLRDAKALRRVEVGLAQAEIDERRRVLTNDVRVACVELAVADRRVELYAQLAKINKGIADFLQAAAERGEASRLDVAGARLAGKALEREGKAAAARRERLSGELRPLLGLGSDARLAIAGDLEVPASSPPAGFDRRSVLGRRPDHQAALIRGDVARAELALAKANRLEDVALRLFAERERSIDAPGGLEGNTFVGVGVSIPLPLRKKNEVAIESATIDLDKSQLEAGAVALEIENEVAVALAARAAAHEVATEATGEILELAAENLKGFQDAYTAGQASFVQVQRAQEQMLDLEKASLELAREYHLAAAAVLHATAADNFAWRGKPSGK